ncbi:MAG: hypothetical protein JWR85_4202 [Marmoricola sp.]|nr:hypothetical protein [Marmoricola sp.]
MKPIITKPDNVAAALAKLTPKQQEEARAWAFNVEPATVTACKPANVGIDLVAYFERLAQPL